MVTSKSSLRWAANNAADDLQRLAHDITAVVDTLPRGTSKGSRVLLEQQARRALAIAAALRVESTDPDPVMIGLLHRARIAVATAVVATLATIAVGAGEEIGSDAWDAVRTHVRTMLTSADEGDGASDPAAPTITSKQVLQTTAELFGFSIEDLRGKGRNRRLVTARQIAMYVLRETTDFSYPAIGREFGDRDHTTVMHAIAKISKLVAERRAVYDQVTEIMSGLKSAS